jgi:hypothetical protein
VSGYRIDARSPGDAAWQPLCRGRTTVAVGALSLGTFDDELSVQTHPVQLDGGTTGDFWLPMYYTSWAGPSLVGRDTALHELNGIVRDRPDVVVGLPPDPVPDTPPHAAACTAAPRRTQAHRGRSRLPPPRCAAAARHRIVTSNDAALPWLESPIHHQDKLSHLARTPESCLGSHLVEPRYNLRHNASLHSNVFPRPVSDSAARLTAP